MGYTGKYFDNAVYGASDLNESLSRLVTSGVADVFADGVAYNATHLNEVITMNGSAGVVPTTVTELKCSINTEAQTVTIAAGTAFFNNGSSITVDAEGVTLPYADDCVNYVYVVSDLSENRCYPMCSTQAPQGDFVMLAEISADGALTDKRTYARGKLPGYQSSFDTNLMYEKTISISRTQRYGAYTPYTEVIHLGLGNNYTKILYTYDLAMATYDLITGACQSYYRYFDNVALNREEIYCQPTSTTQTQVARGIMTFSLEGTDLTLHMDGYDTYTSDNYTLHIPVKLIIF